MSLSTTFTLDTAANFTYDTTKIAVTSAAALKLVNSAIQDFSEDFADDTGITYNSSKAEFVGGVVRQKDLRTAQSTLAVTFTSGLNAAYAQGSLTGTAIGAGAVVGAVLKGDSTSPKGAFWSGAGGNVFSAQKGAIKLKWRPNYTGAPASNAHIFTMRKAISDNSSLLNIYHSSTLLLCTIYNSSATQVITIFGNFSPVSGTWYEIELDYDLDAGATRLFIDGVQVGSTSAVTATRNIADCLQCCLGSNVLNTLGANSDFDDLILFNDVQHTAGYTPGYSIIDAYFAESKVDLPVYTYTGLGTLTIASPPTSTEVGTPRYIIQGKYWTGSAWATSNGTYAQATSKSNILANILTFPTTGLATVTVSVVFGDDTSQSSVSQIDFSLLGQTYAMTNPTIASNSSVLCDGLSSVAVSSSQSGSDLIKYVVSVQNLSTSLTQDYYWNGSAWVVSDGTYTQSNTLAQINTNIATLNSTVLVTGKRVLIKAFLHSADGSTTPTLTSITLVYDFFTELDPDPDTTIVFGYLYDSLNQPIVGAIVTLDNRTAFEYGSRVISRGKVTTTTDSRGYWEFECVENTSVEKVYFFDFAWTVASVDYTLITKAGVTIPSQTSVDFNTLDWEFART